MTTMSANSAKSHFGELLDIARRKPVTIEKHGRPVVVVLSTEEYEQLEAIKLSRLRSEIDAGLDALRQADFIELDQDKMLKAAEEDRAWLEAKPVGNEML